MDRCTGDAVAYVPTQTGRRSLKFVDYGIMAATFVNLERPAFRIISTEESRELAALYAPRNPISRQQQLQAYKIMPDSVMFRVQEVKVDLSPFDLPGPTRRKATCMQCGQVVRDNREVESGGRYLPALRRWGLFYRSPGDCLAGDELVPLCQPRRHQVADSPRPAARGPERLGEER